jgi:hypothetical protein
VWDPTRDDDPKNKQVSVVPLSVLARSVIDSVPIVDGEGDYVFSFNGDTPINGWGRYKRRLDKAMLAKLKEADPAATLKPWQQKDLRRTARTLMPRAGVDNDIAERCLAHVKPGVEGVYDRYSYLPQKKDAFAKLAAFVERIVNPADNVVALPKRG